MVTYEVVAAVYNLTSTMLPSYIKTWETGKLKETAELAVSMLASCEICPRKCKVNRLKDRQGFCKTGRLAEVYSFFAHHGEEPPISGENGSGTIFFSHCNMACLYCQNYEFSQIEGPGKPMAASELAKVMLELQGKGCHNINLVSPTHVIPQILEALLIAVPEGLKIPLVYNTGGYESAETIKLLEGIVDIYLPDMRYADPALSKQYSCAPDYPKHNREAVKEMHRQVGIASMNEQGIMEKGVIVRHLVLPENISGTDRIMKFLAEEISPETYISLMSQYTPYYKALETPRINRRVTVEEYEKAQDIMEACGLANGWTQDAGGLEHFAGIHIKPMFNKNE